MWTGSSRVAPGPMNGNQVLGGMPHKDVEIGFYLAWAVGPGIVVLKFQKFGVPGCDGNAGVPLFVSAQAKPSRAEESLDYIEGITAPSPADIPTLTRTLMRLPLLEPQHMRSKPHQTRLLWEAKCLGYKNLLAAVGAVTADTPKGIELVDRALKAVPSDHDMHSQARGLKIAAARAFRRIGTPRADRRRHKIGRGKDDSRILKETVD